MLSSMPEGPVIQNPVAVASLSSSPPVNNAPSASASPVYSSCPNATEREKMHRKHSARTTTARCLPRDFFRVVVVVIFESFVLLDAFQNEDAEGRKRKKKQKKRYAFYLYLFIYLSIYLSIYLLDAWFLSFFLPLLSRFDTRYRYRHRSLTRTSTHQLPKSK